MAIDKLTTTSFLDESVTNLKIAVSARASTVISSASVGDLSDVDITTSSPSSGQTLVWDNANSKFIPGTSFSQSDFDNALTASDTDDLSEGTTNLYYTDARADARVALVIDSAPATLNTLNELASALGDDANFSTTVTNSIADKLPLAGGTMTGNLTLGDNVNLYLGDSSDASLVFDGTDTKLTSQGELILNGQTGITIDCNNVTNQPVLHISDMGAGNTGILLSRASGGSIMYGQSMDHSRPLAIKGTNKSLGFVVAGGQGNASYAAFDFTIDANASIRHPAVMGVRSPNNNALLFQGEQSDSTVVFSVDYDGNIATSGTVDGRNVATDGTKLDTIETNAKDDQTITAGAGLTGGGTGDVTLSHAATSSQVSLNNSGRTYIQDITLDTYGHITSLATATETVTNTNLTHTGEVTGSTSLTISDNIVDEANLKVSNAPTDGYFLSAQSGNAGGLTWATVPAGYTDSDVASYLSTNDYDTSTNIIAAITDSAPGTLDTLNELAAALGDDDNFSTTVTNSIATKLPLAGGTLTGNVNFNDFRELSFGATNDLRIYTEGTGAFIRTNSGDMKIRIATGNILFQGADGSDTMAKFTHNGATELYYDNAKKIETTATGIDVTGTVDGRDVATDGTKLDGIATSANNYSHPNHSGEVTSSGDGATVIADNIVDEANLKVSNTPTNGYVLTAQSGNTGGLTWAAASAGDSTKLPLAGGTMTGDILYSDGIKAKFGAGSDFQIYHDGTTNKSHITESGASHLVIQGQEIQFKNASGTSLLDLNSAQVELKFNGSKKMETETNGVTVTGNVTVTGTVDGRDVATDGTKLDTIATNADVTDTTNVTAAGALMDSEVTNLAQVKAFDSSDYATSAQGTTADAALPKAGGTITGDILYNDNVKAKFGTSNDLEIYHDGSNSYIHDRGVGNLNIKTNVFRVYNAGGTEIMANFIQNGAAELYHDAIKKFATSAAGIDVTGNIVVSGTVDGRDVATDGTKLDGIDASADVTDTANVTSAGALMDSEVTNLAQVKAFDETDYATAAQGTLAGSAVQPNDSPTLGGLTVDGTDTEVLITEDSEGSATLRFADTQADPAQSYAIEYDTSSNKTNFKINNTQRANFNSSGDYMVGPATADSPFVIYNGNNDATKAGVGLRQTGYIGVARMNDHAMMLNRMGSDGLTMGIRNDGTFVGGLGNVGGELTFHDSTSAEAMRLDSSGNLGINNTNPSSALDVTGSIAVSGTVDGRDVATDGTKLDTIATNANDYTHPNHTGEVTSTGDGATVIVDNVVDAGNLKVTGNGTTTQFLRSDGDGTFTWATPVDTNTVYTHPTHPGDDASIDTGALTGAVVISDLDFNVTTDTLGHVTDANATVATRTLTLANLGYTGETNATADQTKADIEGLSIELPAANLTGTIAAARLSTATTQVESDDSTKIATTAYVTDKITTLIGGAPSTLNDLNELAAAINDDANYNTTLTTALGTKLPLAGGAMTGPITTSSTFDGVDIAARDAVLTSTAAIAAAALPKAGGTMTGDLQLYKATPIITLQRSDNTTLPGLSWQGSGGAEAASIKLDGTSGMTNSLIMSTYNGSTMAERLRLMTSAAGGISVTGNIAVTGTVDGVDIAARDAILTSTTTTAGAALPKAGGAMTGNITGLTALDVTGIVEATSSVNGESSPIIAANKDITAGTNQNVGYNFGLSRNSGAHKPQAGRIEVGRNLDWTNDDTKVDSYMSFSAYTNNVLTEHMRLMPTGNVGIRTTMPNGSLTIADGNRAQFEFYPEYTTDTNLIMNYDRTTTSYQNLITRAATHQFTIGADERMRIDSSGRVGIGTTSPGKLLTVHYDAPAYDTVDDVLRLVNKFTSTNNAASALAGSGPAIVFAGGIGDNQTRDRARIVAPYEGSNVSGLAFHTQNTADIITEKMRIQNNGNVGIGTTSPQKKLEVTGDLQLDATNASIWLKSGAAGTAGKINWTYNTDATVYASAGIDYDTRATTGFHLDAGYPITIDSASSTGIKFITAGSQRAVINNSGLDVTGTVTADGLTVDGLLIGGIGAATTAGTLDWNDSTNARSGQGHTLLLGSATNGPSGGSYYHPFSFEYNTKGGTGNMTQFAIPYNNAEGVYFRSRYSSVWTGWNEMWHSGNDGTGSGLDADLLDGQHGSYYQKKTTVQDAAPSGATGDLWYESDTGSFYVYYSGAWVDVAPGVETNTNLQINSLGVGTAASGTAGEIRATNDVTAYYSDERLKDFHGNIDSALDKVNQLNGYYFTENETAKELGYDNDKRQVGVSAQEVQAVLPEVVAAAPISDEYLTVKYEKLAPLFIEAIKEIDKKYQDKIDMLMEEIEKLKGN